MFADRSSDAYHWVGNLMMICTLVRLPDYWWVSNMIQMVHGYDSQRRAIEQSREVQEISAQGSIEISKEQAESYREGKGGKRHHKCYRNPRREIFASFAKVEWSYHPRETTRKEPISS